MRCLMSFVCPWIGYLLEFLVAEIVAGGTAGRSPKLMDQIDQKPMLFQHFPHTYSSYRFMVTGVGSRPVTQHEHKVLKMITQGASTSDWFSFCLYMPTGEAFWIENGLWHDWFAPQHRRALGCQLAVLGQTRSTWDLTCRYSFARGLELVPFLPVAQSYYLLWQPAQNGGIFWSSSFSSHSCLCSGNYEVLAVLNFHGTQNSKSLLPGSIVTHLPAISWYYSGSYCSTVSRIIPFLKIETPTPSMVPGNCNWWFNPSFLNAFKFKSTTCIQTLSLLLWGYHHLSNMFCHRIFVSI